MTSAETYVDQSEMDRRSVLKRVLIGGGVAAAALAAPGLTGIANASESDDDDDKRRGKKINLGITINFDSFETTGGGVGAFYVGGDISAGEPGGDSIGTFHCWGWITSDGGVAVVNQEFNINGRGKIQISGVESHDLRAVIGGTGDFVNARGQGNPHTEDTFGHDHISPTGTFVIEFRLTGAKGRPIG
ncbi:MAG: hypothetical protein BMS9Abin20_1422 [Acidimicrobiia bacterium]|nr:MAG: hypothetical protein BMS9Abin20_1422 [Acidimicrobiia bacterium]